MTETSAKTPERIWSHDGTKSITVEEFDKMFDDGSDEIDDFIDWSKGKMVYPKPRRVNVDFPPMMVRDLDEVANARGVTRQALIKMWLADKLDEHRRGQRPAAE
jgi:CopG antitoxin of type II toxin-antitoxin system